MVEAAIRARPDTLHYVAEADVTAGVAGLALAGLVIAVAGAMLPAGWAAGRPAAAALRAE